MKYDTKDAPEYTVAPEGEHNAVVTDVEIYDAGTGPNKLKVEFSLEDQSTHREFVIPSIMEGDGFRVFADLLTLISDSDSLAPEGDFDPQDFVGLECVISIKHTEGKGKHKGKTFANILKIEAPKKA